MIVLQPEIVDPAGLQVDRADDVVVLESDTLRIGDCRFPCGRRNAGDRAVDRACCRNIARGAGNGKIARPGSALTGSRLFACRFAAGALALLDLLALCFQFRRLALRIQLRTDIQELPGYQHQD